MRVPGKNGKRGQGLIIAMIMTMTEFPAEKAHRINTLAGFSKPLFISTGS